MKTIKFIFFSLCFVAAVSFYSCEDLGNGEGTIEVELDDVSFDIPVDLSSDASLRSANADFTSFSGQSGPISLQSAMFEKIKGYSASAIVLVVSDVKVKITTTSESGTTVKEFTSNTLENGSTLYSYEAGDDIELNKDFSDAELTKYMKNILLAIQSGKTVNIDVAGLTDIVPSAIEGVDLTVVSIIPTLTAKISVTKE